MGKVSPMMEQYFNIKNKYKDTILFFRLGDFYEMFYDDAEKISKELELTLTGRDCGEGKRAPMCGVPYHSCEAYIERLIKKGYKVAICEQGDINNKSKGLVEREVVRVVTPGTIMEGSMLDESSNNYICSIFYDGEQAGICFCDVSTGALDSTFIDEDIEKNIINEVSRFAPSEILLNKRVLDFKKLIEFCNLKLKSTIELLDDNEVVLDNCKDMIKNHFMKELSELNIDNKKSLICSLGSLINYLRKTQMTGLQNINNLKVYQKAQFMSIDYNTRRNLELTETMIKLEKKGSLLWVLDKTKSAMGKRMMKSFVERPLVNVEAINDRLDVVQELKDDAMLNDSLRECLNSISDIERLMTKVVYGSCNARDLKSLANTIELLPQIKSLLNNTHTNLLLTINNRLSDLKDTYKTINNAIVDEPPFSVREGGLIKSSYNASVDELKDIIDNSTEYLAKIESEQRQKTGIPKLKIGYNRVFGYYIEVTNSYKSQVPEEYIRKQTLANCERYITQDLKVLEGKILGAKDKLVQIEYDLFDEVRKQTAKKLKEIQSTATALAILDVLCSFAYVSSQYRYVRPKVNNGDKIIIESGRHPVVERILRDVPFVPNNVNLDNQDNRCAIITGPNMAGKSTYMRQTAIITLMAQMGSFVPADNATIGIVDSIFTRVGASDDLAAGQSTFMVEMNEVSEILKKATPKSLIILDEIGRGTSTFDGMSIAKAVLEYTVNKDTLGAKTLFSTHYHELIEMEHEIDGIKNYNVSVKKRGDDITFLRRIVKGGADESYGIEVAKLAGLPNAVIKRSKQILKDISKEEYKIQNKDQISFNEITDERIVLNDKEKEIIDKIKNIDTNTLTPIESLNILFELSNLLK